MRIRRKIIDPIIALNNKLLSFAGRKIIYDKQLNETIRLRMKLIEKAGIDIVLDVGANIGQYAKELREKGYNNKIISFEPVSSSYAELANNSNDDPKWVAHKYALGANESEELIHVAQRSVRSSFLDMTEERYKHGPGTTKNEYIDKETVQIYPLDKLYGDLCNNDVKKVMLKIDVQGFEREVLEGAKKSLKSITLVQMEMSLTPMYKGEMMIGEAISFMNEAGFDIVLIEPGYANFETGRQLQVDGIFLKR